MTAREKEDLLAELERLRRRVQELEHSRAELQRFLDHLTTFTGLLAPDGTLRLASRAAVEAAGAPAEELVGRHFAETYWWSHDPGAQRRLREAIGRAARGETAVFHERVRTRRGPIEVQVILRPVYDERGRLAWLVVEGQDLTPLREAEREVHLAHQLFHALSSLVAIADRDGRLRLVNQRALERLGFGPEEVLGRPFWECPWIAPLPEEAAKVRASVEAALRGETRRVETVGLTRQGERLHIYHTSSPLRDEAGQVVGVALEGVEVGELKRREQELAAERERLLVTLRSIGDGVIVTDREGRIQMLNAVAEQLTAWPESEARGRPIHEVFRIVNEKTGQPCENPVAKVIERGVVVGLANHTMLIARDGTRRLLADSGAPIRDAAGRIIGVVLVFRDVTAKRRLEEEMAKVERMESLGVLAGGIAHDFNNLLTGLLGNISLALHRAGDAPPELRERLVEAERACLRARALTQQLLTFARGGAPLREPLSVAEVLREAACFALHGSRSRCRFELPPDLWPVEADAGQLHQAIVNLVINADQAMPQGGTVRISARNVWVTPEEGLPLEPGRYVQVSIQDHGVGIPPEHLPRVLEPFFTTKQRGSGLGLATAYSILRRHDGHLRVDSELGRGTTVHLWLPASEREPERAAVGAEEVVRGHGRVLVMDDEEMVREVLGEMLRYLGYEVAFAQDGAEAVRMYRRSLEEGRPFDCVILDLTVPGGMGGREALRRLRRIDPKVRAIVSSGYSQDPVVAQHRRYGFQGVVVKPFDLRQLSQVLHEVMAGERP